MNATVFPNASFKYTPHNISSSTLANLEDLLKLACTGGMFSAVEVAEVLKILRTNPCYQLANIGMRLDALKTFIGELISVDQRATIMLNTLETQLTTIAAIVNTRPDWLEAAAAQQARANSVETPA